MSKKKWKSVYYGEYGPIKVRENGESTLFRRACMRLRYESFFAATQHYAPVIQDLERLAQMKKGPSLQLQGKIWAVQAKVKAHLAQDGHDLTDALRLMDRAETVIGQSVSEDFAYLVALDEERYFLDRAEVLMLSPQKEPAFPPAGAGISRSGGLAG